MIEKEFEKKQSCPCAQAAADLLRSVSPIKEEMLKEVKCKRCGKTFLTNFETEYCFDCRGKLHKVVCKRCGKTFWIDMEVGVCMDCESKT